MALLIENKGNETVGEEDEAKVSNYNKIKFAPKFIFQMLGKKILFIIKIDTFLLLPQLFFYVCWCEFPFPWKPKRGRTEKL
jgi:hypothetical protein